MLSSDGLIFTMTWGKTFLKASHWKVCLDNWSLRWRNCWFTLVNLFETNPGVTALRAVLQSKQRPQCKSPIAPCCHRAKAHHHGLVTSYTYTAGGGTAGPPSVSRAENKECFNCKKKQIFKLLDLLLLNSGGQHIKYCKVPSMAGCNIWPWSWRSFLCLLPAVMTTPASLC